MKLTIALGAKLRSKKNDTVRLQQMEIIKTIPSFTLRDDTQVSFSLLIISFLF